jgi:TolB-like protein
MKNRAYIAFASVLLIWAYMTGSVWAVEFVSDKDRAWARNALQQEKSFKAEADGPRTLAVLYFNNRTGWKQLDLLQKGLSLMLMTDLAKVKEIQLVERVKVQALVEEMGFGASGLVSVDTVPRVGKVLGAKLLVGGDIGKGGADIFQVNSDLLNVPTEKPLGSPSVDGKLLEELFRMEKDLLFEIIELLRIQLTPGQREELKEPITDSLEALFYWFEAVEQGDQGNYQQARDLLEKAAEIDRDFPNDLLAFDETNGGSDSGGGGSDGSSIDGGGGGKACAAERNKLLRQSLKRRRF